MLVAPDSFKGTFGADAVARAIGDGLRGGGREAIELPIADGGEGTMDVLVAALGGERRSERVTDPLGREVEAAWALLHDGRAVVECAQASGLGLVAEDELDAYAASSRGTGELIVAAVRAGAEVVLVTVGGVATSDGGEGAISALEQAGARPALEVLCDVRIPWERAPGVFSPQKGADAQTVRRLERRLHELAECSPRDPRGVPMSGAAGGLSGGLWARCAAKLAPGAPYVLDALGFDAAMRSVAFVITGEGRLDRQTLHGKAAAEVATRCRQRGVGCHAVVGSSALEAFEQRILDLETVTEASTLAELEDAGRALADH